MPRARNKEDLLQFSEENYSKLLKMISAMSENQMSTEFDFSDDEGKKEAHWGRDKNVRDVLIHLYEWHQLLIKFVEHNTSEENKIAFLPPEYSWKTYGEMNVMLWKRHQGLGCLEKKYKMNKNELKSKLQKLGIEKNMKILLHVSLSKIGYLDNGPETLIESIEELISPYGILSMPAFNSYGNYKPHLSIVNDYFKNQYEFI